MHACILTGINLMIIVFENLSLECKWHVSTHTKISHSLHHHCFLENLRGFMCMNTHHHGIPLTWPSTLSSYQCLVVEKLNLRIIELTNAWLPIGIIKGGKTMEVACMCLLCILSTLTQSCLTSSNNNNYANQTQIQLSLSHCCMCGPFYLYSLSVYWKSKENIGWVLSEVGDPTKLATGTSWLTS